MATNWKLLAVDEPPSDEEEEEDVVSESGPASVLSPQSKRARKRAAAKDRKQAKQGALIPPVASSPSSSASSSRPSGSAAGSAPATIPAPPTFVNEAPAAPASQAPAAQAQEQCHLQSQSMSQSRSLGADTCSSEDEEDATLLVDSASESDVDSEDDEDAGEQEQGNDGDLGAAVQSTAHDALLSGAQSGAVPDTVNKQAAKGAKATEQDEKEAAAAGASQKPLNHGADHDPTKKWKAIITRTVWTLVMIVGFCGLVLMGPVYLIILVIVCQALVFKEISALFDVAAKPIHSSHHPQHQHSANRVARDARARAERERWSKLLSWYFFAATNYFLHGETIIYYFKHIVFVDAYFIPFARHHRFISFMLYVLGFVGFVTNLKRNQLRRQFGLFCWIHMSLLLIVVSSHFIVNNILEGIIWFWVPASLVVMNDIAAYVWGMLFGRTQLIKLSPKKTVEGFVGAFFTTVVFGYAWATFFMRFSYMICPATDLGTTAFSNLTCTPNDAFVWRTDHQIAWAPFQIHAVAMAIFASLVAPFGGFFASGFKRAFNIKDFGDSIPGHGGMTDRMDCQFMMGLFAYVYYSSIVRDNHVTVGAVMQTIVSSLSTQDQIELAKALSGYLAQQGLEC